MNDATIIDEIRTLLESPALRYNVPADAAKVIARLRHLVDLLDIPEADDRALNEKEVRR